MYVGGGGGGGAADNRCCCPVDSAVAKAVGRGHFRLLAPETECLESLLIDHDAISTVLAHCTLREANSIAFGGKAAICLPDGPHQVKPCGHSSAAADERMRGHTAHSDRLCPNSSTWQCGSRMPELRSTRSGPAVSRSRQHSRPHGSRYLRFGSGPGTSARRWTRRAGSSRRLR